MIASPVLDLLTIYFALYLLVTHDRVAWLHAIASPAHYLLTTHCAPTFWYCSKVSTNDMILEGLVAWEAGEIQLQREAGE